MAPVGGRYALRCAMPSVGEPRLGFGVGDGGGGGGGGGGGRRLCFVYGLKVSKQVTLLVKTVCCMACQEWNKVQEEKRKEKQQSYQSLILPPPAAQSLGECLFQGEQYSLPPAIRGFLYPGSR